MDDGGMGNVDGWRRAEDDEEKKFLKEDIARLTKENNSLFVCHCGSQLSEHANGALEHDFVPIGYHGDAYVKELVAERDLIVKDLQAICDLPPSCNSISALVVRLREDKKIHENVVAERDRLQEQLTTARQEPATRVILDLRDDLVVAESALRETVGTMEIHVKDKDRYKLALDTIHEIVDGKHDERLWHEEYDGEHEYSPSIPMTEEREAEIRVVVDRARNPPRPIPPGHGRVPDDHRPSADDMAKEMKREASEQ
jgi:hypothetical protein